MIDLVEVHHAKIVHETNIRLIDLYVETGREIGALLARRVSPERCGVRSLRPDEVGVEFTFKNQAQLDLWNVRLEEKVENGYFKRLTLNL